MDDQKTREERIKELLDAPAADAVRGIKGPSLADIAPVAETVNAGEGDSDAEGDDSGDKKIRIRKSRLNTLEREIESLRSQVETASTYQQRVAALEAQLTLSHRDEDSLPDWWVEAYGDTEVSKKGYAHQQRIFREELAREFERREAEREAELAEREKRVSAIEQSFDVQMDALEESIGRELTKNQKAELLDIVGEYSPTDDEGNYLAYMPVEKAYELWSKGQSKDDGKREMADIANIKSAGSSSTDSSWRPGNWRQKYGL